MKTETTKMEQVKAILFEGDHLFLLDQTLLPGEKRYIPIETKESAREAIYRLRVRGAPAIGVAAAYSLYISIKYSEETEPVAFVEEVGIIKAYLAEARPTAVNLFWALERMMTRLEYEFDLSNNNKDHPAVSVEALKLALRDEAVNIHREDEEICRRLGEEGLTLLKPGMGILTHCNAGALATSGCGTALAPIYAGHQQKFNFKVYADETRPLLQGARLTAWELKEAGVDVTLICDNMASIVMKNGWVDAVLVGCDRMAMNGDGANKIGTSGVAILAKEYGIPFYIFVPISTIDVNAETGKDIPIELRHGEEIYKMWYTKDMAPNGIKTYNPSFDVTEHKYITAIVTEKGVIYPPFDVNLKALMDSEKG